MVDSLHSEHIWTIWDTDIKIVLQFGWFHSIAVFHSCAPDGDSLGDVAGVESSAGEGDDIAVDGGRMGLTECIDAIIGGDVALMVECGDKRGLCVGVADHQDGSQQGKDKLFHSCGCVFGCLLTPPFGVKRWVRVGAQKKTWEFSPPRLPLNSGLRIPIPKDKQRSLPTPSDITRHRPNPLTGCGMDIIHP